MNQIQPTTQIFILPLLINFRPIFVFNGSLYQFGLFTIFLTREEKWTKFVENLRWCIRDLISVGMEWLRIPIMRDVFELVTLCVCLCVCVCVCVCVCLCVGGWLANLWLTWFKIPFHFAHESPKVEYIS